MTELHVHVMTVKFNNIFKKTNNFKKLDVQHIKWEVFQAWKL